MALDTLSFSAAIIFRAHLSRSPSSVIFIACCVATGTLFVDLPDHSICGMSHPDRLA